jgi:hypothetical protein
MTQEHPITPPPELVMEWINKHYGGKVHRDLGGVEHTIATCSARWGADQELEACIEWMGDSPVIWRGDPEAHPGFYLREARRPNPPNLKELALATLQKISKDKYPCNYQDDKDWDTIRRALESLPD